MLHSNKSNEIDCPSLRLSNRGLRTMCEERDKIPRFTRISFWPQLGQWYSCKSRDFIPFLAHVSQTAIRQSQRWTIDFVWYIGMQHWTQFRKDGQSISRKTDNHNFVHFDNRRRRRLRLFWQKVCFFFWRCVFFFFWCLFCLFRLVLFADLKRNNLFAQECRLVGLTIDRDVGNDRSFKSLQELRAKINVSTRTLEVGTIISDEANGGPLQLTYQLKGETKNALATSNIVEPLVYPLFFPYGERGWGAELSPGILWNK